MSINIENKQKDINNFMNEKYFPLLKEYEVSEEELNTIVQNIVNNLNNEEYVEQLDTEDYRSLIDMATNGGIVYKDAKGTQFEDINEAFISSTLGAMALLCKKNGVPMEDYSLGNTSILPTEAEEKVAGFGREERIMFLTGNKEAFYIKYGNVQKKDLLEQKKELLEASKVEQAVVLDELPSAKKTL